MSASRLTLAKRASFLGCCVIALLASGCERPDSIELGATCKGSAECKDPADTCLTIANESRCTMACDKTKRCPEGYACPVTDATQKDRGMCLPKASLGPNVVTVY
jgi:hypothetical protein